MIAKTRVRFVGIQGKNYSGDEKAILLSMKCQRTDTMARKSPRKVLPPALSGGACDESMEQKMAPQNATNAPAASIDETGAPTSILPANKRSDCELPKITAFPTAVYCKDMTKATHMIV
jgi:hypothetical protein